MNLSLRNRFLKASRQKSRLVASTAAAAALIGNGAESLAAQQQASPKGPTRSDAKSASSTPVIRPSQGVHRLNIPAGTLREVLAAFSTATGLKVVYANDNLATLASQGVSGVFTIEDALIRILNGTETAATFESAERVRIGLRAVGSSMTVVDQQELPSPKYTAPLRDLPQTVTVIPETVIQNTGSVSLVEALRTVPGITLGAGEGGNPVGDRPFLRGSDSQSSTFLDGMRDIGSQSREVFNLESVEVTKGPNGAMGGRGTSGGSINLNSKSARPQNSIGGGFSPGTAGFLRGNLDANLKLRDSLAFRLNAVKHSQDVAGRDGVHFSRWGVAPTLTAGLGKRTRAIFSYYHLDSNDMPDAGIPYSNPTFNVRADTIPRILQTGDGAPLGNVNRRVFYGLLNRDFRRDKMKSGTIRLEHNLTERISLRNTTRYTKSNQDYIWTQPDDSQGNIYYGMVWRRTNTRISDVDTLSNQIDLYGDGKTGFLRHNFAVGGEFSRERGENDSYTVATGSNRCLTGQGAAAGYNCTDLFNPNMNDPWTGAITRNNNPTNSRTGTRALYAFDTVSILPKLQATLGLRADGYNARFASARAAATGIRSEFRRKDTLVNYQVGLVYKPVQTGSIYGSFNTSSNPVGNSLAQGSDPNALSSAINENLVPEKNKTAEFGVKWEVFSSRALLTAAVFRNETKNARITLQDGTVAMAGERRVNGIELGIAGKVTKNWQVFAGYNWLDAILVRNGGSGAAFGLQDGVQFPNTPRHSFSLTSNYAFTSRLSAGGGIYAMAKVWGGQPANKWVPSYTRADLYANYQVHKHLGLQFNLQNLADTLYYDRAYPTHYATLAPGRSARVTMNVQF